MKIVESGKRKVESGFRSFPRFAAYSHVVYGVVKIGIFLRGRFQRPYLNRAKKKDVKNALPNSVKSLPRA